MPTSTKPSVIAERVHIDRKTGKQTRLYFAREKVCPKVALTSPLARRYAGYCLIKADLLDAQGWLLEAFNLLPTRSPMTAKSRESRVDQYFHVSAAAPFKLIKALWFAALVLYGKSFTQAEGRRVKLERTNLPVEVRDYHDEMMTLRHTIVAHAGRTSHESSDLYLVLDPNPKRCGFWLRADIRRVDFSDDRKDPVTFERLIQLAIEHATEKLTELEGRVKERDLLVHPIEHWYDKARRP